ncbi:MAG TPA: hypothetical protein VN851_10445 [Thermoanaerobaculia bacterium]|nr:hypothetical protein [Thermoanaerobaculia bacterium]
MKSRTFIHILLLGLAFGATAAPGHSETHDIALGSNGDLYRVRAGTYQDLFPSLAQSNVVVLALDITRPGADGPSTQRLLVPGTAGNDVESSPALFFEESSKRIFLVWESRINPLHSVLYLTSMASGEFGDVVQISGDQYSFKGSPRIAVSHDTFDVTGADNQPERHYRTIVQTVWWETTGDGDHAVYAPVVLIDGIYLGWNPVFPLDDLATAESTRVLATPTGPLLHAPSIQLGDDGATVATFVNSETGRLNTAEIDVLPVDLSEIAARVRAKILSFPRIPTPISLLADPVRSEIIDFGGALHPSLRHFLADQVRSEIIDFGSRYNPGQVRRLSDFIRSEIIDFGADAFGGRGGRQQNLVYRVTEVMATPTAEPTVEKPGHALSLHTAVDLPIPETGDAVPNIYTSTHGDSLIVSWQQDDQILYRESTADGWTDVLSIALGANMTQEQAEQILAQRAKNR